jgi:carbamoylphosphate synthase small subunit
VELEEIGIKEEIVCMEEQEVEAVLVKKVLLFTEEMEEMVELTELMQQQEVSLEVAEVDTRKIKIFQVHQEQEQEEK